MSRVYFHSPSGGAELRGSERAWLGALCADIAIGVLNLDRFGRDEKITDLINPASRLSRLPTDGEFQTWRHNLETALRVQEPDGLLRWRGRPLSSFHLVLNTALTVGGDALRLAARIHGQCELHGWVDGPNRAWLADIVQAAVDAGVFRARLGYHDGPDGPMRVESQGWDEVIGLLRARDDEPVVMSYSVCDGFPNAGVAGWEPVPLPVDWRPDWADGDGFNEWHTMSASAQEEYRREALQHQWFELDEVERWRLGVEGLRARGAEHLELRPGTWADVRFGRGVSMLDVIAWDRDARFDAAFSAAVSEEPKGKVTAR